MNKKGMDISLNFIILAVLALIALIIIALFFTGGLTNLFKQQQDVGSISSEKVALYAAKCNLYCTTDDYYSWYHPQFAEESLATKNCETADLGLEDVTWVQQEGEWKCVKGTIPGTTT